MICSSAAPKEDRAAVESEVDACIAEFNKWFVSKGNSDIVRGEKAIIKTFLYYMLFEAK